MTSEVSAIKIHSTRLIPLSIFLLSGPFGPFSAVAQNQEVQVTQAQPEQNVEFFMLNLTDEGPDQAKKEFVLANIEDKRALNDGYLDRHFQYSDINDVLFQERIPVTFFASAQHTVGLYAFQGATAQQVANFFGFSFKLITGDKNARNKLPESVFAFHKSTIDVLSRISKSLYLENVEYGRQLIEHGRLGNGLNDPEKIDDYLIKRDQDQLQSVLDSLPAATRNEVVDDMNRTINRFADGREWVADRVNWLIGDDDMWDTGAFQMARHEIRLSTKNLKAQLSFGNLQHRLLIGKYISKRVSSNAQENYKLWRDIEKGRSQGAALSIGDKYYSHSLWFRQGENINIEATGIMKMYDEVCTPKGVVAKTAPFWSMIVEDNNIYGALMGQLDGKLSAEDREKKQTKWFVIGNNYQFTAPFSGWMSLGINSGTPAKSGDFNLKIRVTGRK